MHAIRVNWFEKGGEEVRSHSIGQGRASSLVGIDKAIVMTADGVSGSSSEQEVVKAVDPDKFVFDPSLVESWSRAVLILGVCCLPP